MCLELAELKKLKLFNFEVTEILHLDFEATGDVSKCEGCRNDVFKEAVGIWG